MNFMINAEMGFDRDVVYNIRLRGHDYKKAGAQYSRLPEVRIISNASHVPGVGNVWDLEIKHPDYEENMRADYFSVDPNYISAMGLKLISGQDFPENISTENEKFIIISELAVEKFNFGSPEEAIGKSMFLDDTIQVEIIHIKRKMR